VPYPSSAHEWEGSPKQWWTAKPGSWLTRDPHRLLRAAMERMVRDASFRAEAGRRSLRRAEDCFDPDASTRSVAEALKALSRIG
jgi:hypothetical protein